MPSMGEHSVSARIGKKDCRLTIPDQANGQVLKDILGRGY